MIKESNTDYIEIHLGSTTDMKNEIIKTQSQETFAHLFSGLQFLLENFAELGKFELRKCKSFAKKIISKN